MRQTAVFCALVPLVLIATGCQRTAAPKDPWTQYADSIDELVSSYVTFNEADIGKRQQILADYARAKIIRDEYHRTAKIPVDPLVIPIDANGRTFTPSGTHVSVLLAANPALECHVLRVDKPAGAAGHIVVIGGNRSFWVDHRRDAKFISAAFTLPTTENYLEIRSQSWSPGKIIIVFLVGAAVSLSGCTEGTATPAPPACATVFATAPTGAKYTAAGAMCSAPGAACPGGTCRTRLQDIDSATGTHTYNCECR